MTTCTKCRRKIDRATDRGNLTRTKRGWHHLKCPPFYLAMRLMFNEDAVIELGGGVLRFGQPPATPREVGTIGVYASREDAAADRPGSQVVEIEFV